MPRQSEGTVDEAKIEDVFTQGADSPGSHREIVVVDDRKFESAPAQSVVAPQSGVNLLCATRLGYFAYLRLEQNMFSPLQAPSLEPIKSYRLNTLSEGMAVTFAPLTLVGVQLGALKEKRSRE